MTRRRKMVRTINARLGGPRKSRVRTGPLPIVVFVLLILVAAALAEIMDPRSLSAVGFRP